MNNNQGASLRPSEEIYEKSTAYIIEHFKQYMLDSIDEGYLQGIAPTVIETLAKSFAQEQSTHIVHYLTDSINAHLEWKEREVCSKMRQRPFDRLLVKRFSKWFPRHGDLTPEANDLFSRRMLPSLIKSLEMMAGQDEQRKFEQAVSGYWLTIMDAKGEAADWEDLYVSIDANEAVDTYLAHIALSFKNFDERLDWFVRAINNGLGQAEKYAFEGEGVWAWAINEPLALKLLRTLYSPISKRVHDARKREAFEKGLEPKLVHQTYSLLDTLAQRK